MTLTLRLSPADSALIRQYATEKGLSVSELIRRCVLERIEDEFDLETYQKSLEAYKTSPSTYSSFQKYRNPLIFSEKVV